MKLYLSLNVQVVKAMPVQFTTYITKLFLSYLDKDYVDKIKIEYCSLSELPESACESCWLKDKCEDYL